MNYLIFAVSLLLACILTRRYAISWWICVMASSAFFLLAVLIASPILMVVMMKETLHLTWKAVRDE